MKCLKRRLKGAISVFLIIIMVSNYALIGVLVDSARHRMARANAEMALDTAAASVLSYYNKMVFDLYGLFATDSLSQDEIKTLLTDYTKKTLGVTQMSQSEVTELSKAIVDAIPYFQKDSIDGILFDGYHYDISIETDDSLLSYSLANTDAVEAQIIDHMKYKAPAAMLEGLDGFLEDLNAILNVADRISKTKDKIETTKDDKEHLSQEASNLLDEIKAYNAKITYFSQTGKSGSETVSGGAYDPWTRIDEFDKKLDEIAAMYNYDGDDDEAVVEALWSAYSAEIDTLEQDFNNLSTRAEALLDEANDIRDKTEALNTEFEKYIAKLNAKLDEDRDDENLKTLYLPEIELAKATMGEVLKNIDLVLMGRQYTNNLRTYISDYIASLLSSAHSAVDHRMGNAEGPAYLRSVINSSAYGHSNDSASLMSDMKRDFAALYDYANSFREIKEPTLKTEDVSSNNVDKDKVDKETKTDDLRSLTESDMEIEFQETESPEWEGTVDGIEDDNSIALLQAGLDLLKAIGELLEGARDSLYVNEYIISYFPNYVQHYNAMDSDLAKEHSNKRLVDEKDYYKAFNASQAELEYILVGDTDAAKNVAAVSAELTAIRMVFNTVAIMTDSAKIQQANMLAASAGPFAPVVSIALLLAWALGESVLDTLALLDGEEVLVFKQGSDWTISLEGGVKKVAEGVLGKVGDVMEDAVNKQIDTLADSARSVGNTIVYDAYQKISDGTDVAINTANDELSKWSNSVQRGISGSDTPFVDTSGAIREITNPAASTVRDLEGQAKDRALVAIDNGVETVRDKIQDKGSELINRGVDTVTDAVSKKLAGSFEVGNAIETGSGSHGMFEIKFNYLDYMRIFLMFSSKETRLQRIQKLIQANVRYGSDKKDFKMSESYVSLGATLTGSIDFLFMSNAILPDHLKQNGKLKFTASTSMSY